MVKGISKQVILVRPPEPRLFEQAIFILREGAEPKDATEEALLKEARIAASYPRAEKKQKMQCVLCCAGGAAVTSVLWLISMLL